MKLKVIGLATEINNEARNWMKGVEAAGLHYKLLGVGQKFTGWKMRSELYKKELTDDTDTDVFIITDVYDVLVNQKVTKRIKNSGKSVEEYILSTFCEFKKPIVVGTEKSCSLRGNCHFWSFNNMFKILQKDYTFPNAGLVIGYRPSMIKLYSHLLNYPNDQLELGKLINKYPDEFALDKKSKLFYNFLVYPVKERFHTAIFVHFPGMKPIIPNRLAYNSFDYYKSIPLFTWESCKVSLGALLLFAILLYLLFWIYSNMNPKKIHDISYHLF
jgi:hypothetical protein